jgi:hypothetical protein
VCFLVLGTPTLVGFYVSLGAHKYHGSVVEERWKAERAARRAAAPKLIRDLAVAEQMQRLSIEIYKDPVPDEGELLLPSQFLVTLPVPRWRGFLRLFALCAAVPLRAHTHTHTHTHIFSGCFVLWVWLL